MTAFQFDFQFSFLFDDQVDFPLSMLFEGLKFGKGSTYLFIVVL